MTWTARTPLPLRGAELQDAARVPASLAGRAPLGVAFLRRGGLLDAAGAGGARWVQMRSSPSLASLPVAPARSASPRTPSRGSSACAWWRSSRTSAIARRTGATVRTAACTARTTCSRGSPTRSWSVTASQLSPTATTPTTPAAPTARARTRPPITPSCGHSPTPASARPRYAASLGRSRCRAPTSPPRRAWRRGSPLRAGHPAEACRRSRSPRRRCARWASATCECATTHHFSDVGFEDPGDCQHVAGGLQHDPIIGRQA
jgi:hypothetical protein